jgi:hypothetical protein
MAATGRRQRRTYAKCAVRMQHFCEPLKSGSHEAIYRELDVKHPEIKPSTGSWRLKLTAAGSN